MFETCCWCCRPSGSGGRHLKGEHVKDAAQDGSVKVLILSIVIFRWRQAGSRVHGGPPRRPPGAFMCGHRCATTTKHWTPLPHHHRRHRRQHVKDAAQGAAENISEDVAQDLAFGDGRRAPSSPRHHRHHHRRRRLCTARTEMGVQLGSSVEFLILGRNWAAQWHLARDVGKRFRGCRAKRLCVYFTIRAF